jgi:Tol biopolymer transport system component
MTYSRALVAALCVLLLLAGCEQPSVSDQEQIAQRETVLAGTPSPSPTPTITTTPSPTPTLTSTIGPSPTAPPPTATLPPTITPLPPTATPNTALRGFSYCTQQAGERDGGRFSAQLSAVKVEGFPAFERVTLSFTRTLDANLNASAACLSQRAWTAAADDPAAPGPYVLEVQLPNWLHDESFAASAITRTLAFTTTRVVRNISFRFDPAADAGATIDIPVPDVLRYKLDYQPGPARLVLDVAKTSEFTATSDLLSVPLGDDPPALDRPVFFLLDGDVWSTSAVTTTNLTRSPEQETALAVSPDGKTLAFCRTAPGATSGAAGQSAPGALLTSSADGGGVRTLASIGFNCADPSFSPDGRRLAWSVDETGVAPALRSVWTIPLAGGPAQRASGSGDVWSRTAPQWLSDDALLYAADSPDGRSTLLLRTSAGEERDVGAGLLVGDNGNQHAGFGRPIANADGDVVAVEARRSNTPGSDVVLLDSDGQQQAVIGAGSNGAPFWTRPLAWQEDGSLVYLAIACDSTLVQEYTLHIRAANGDDQVIASGATLGTIGSATANNGALAYVLGEQSIGNLRDPLALDAERPASLWLWDIENGGRGRLYDAPRALTDLRR